MKPEQPPKVLDGMSELMVLSNYPDAKNIMLFGFDLEGSVNVEALNLALRKTLLNFPQFSSSVKEFRVRGERRMVWNQEPDFQPTLRVSNMETPHNSIAFQNLLLLHLDKSLEKDWDLLHTAPTEFHLIRLPQGHSSLLTLVHHAAADGWSLSAFYQELLAYYHRIVTDQEPEWASESLHAPSLKKGMVQRRRRIWSDALFVAKKTLSSYFARPTLPKGSAKKKEKGVHYFKSVLTPEQTNNFVNHVSRHGGPFTDGLVGGLACAVDQWNEFLNLPKGNIVICVTVQLRGRFGESEAPTNTSSLVLKFKPSERINPELFSKSVALRRQNQLDSLFDVQTWQAGCSLATAIRGLHLSVKQRIVHLVCQMPIIPILIAPFGMMWPEIKDGRRTGDSYLKQAGGLILNEFHAIPYKLGYRCPLILGAYTFRKRLNLQLMASASHFTRTEAECFMKLLAEVLVKEPFGIKCS
ncbi:MAG: hypothetical protein ACP5VS_08935 [Desulfomonilaceae bacterium]